MSTKSTHIAPLAELSHGEEADFFLLMTTKEALTTRDGKPFSKVGFRDATMEVSFPIWNDSGWYAECRDTWVPGECYKIRAIFQDTNYGPQLDIRKIRPVEARDRDDGFDPHMCLPRSRFEPEVMFDELISLARQRIGDPALSGLVVGLLESNRADLLTLPSATRNHHAFVGGFLEHVLSVTRTCLFLADKYDDYYPDLQPRLNKDLVVAGAILHDIGKLRELEQRPEGASYTPAGHLIGHILHGRDMVREAAVERSLSPETLLRLEHIVVAHQGRAEWGSPKPPMTPEALIVHYADDLDAKYFMMVDAIQSDTNHRSMTSNHNALRQAIFRGIVDDSGHTLKPR